MAAITEMDPTEFAYGDMYFTTYMNQVPYQLENELTELPQEFAFSAGEGRIRNKIYMHRALIRLYDHLGKNTSPFEKLEHYPKIYQRDTRSPCANDRCLFLTNKHSFPDVRLFRYKPYINISESEQIHESYYKTQHFIEFPYSHAVDGKDWTAWKSKENIHANDYIGLDLLLPMHVPLTFHLVVDHKPDYFGAQSVEISNDGLNWVKQSSIPIDIHKVSRTSDGRKTPVISATFHIQNTGFRFVRVLSNRNFDFGFGVYDFSFHADMKSIQKKP
ncbi:4852_t:CDS:2 [Paraglomus occultum]|uniref:4852_t:CDS:1 n=1 Tax=Paraglomus occultum TaxID=144539 RepID=A0A9N8ZLJ1_9GLOM|nr:4852_t:CDS:2 [Paraglomus occultum]